MVRSPRGSHATSAPNKRSLGTAMSPGALKRSAANAPSDCLKKDTGYHENRTLMLASHHAAQMSMSS